MQTHNILWQVSLENGKTFQEGKGEFAEVQGELSPWNKLLQYLQTNNTQITSLVLVSVDRYFNLPTTGRNPNFKPFRTAEKPLSYKVERYIAEERNWNGTGDPSAPQLKDWYTVASAVYDKYILQLWVNEIDTRHCWALVVPKL